MSFETTTTAEVARSNGLKVLVYGLAGVGKTMLCATTGDLDKTLIISCEGGLLSLRKHDIAAVEIHNLDELREVYDALARGEHPFEWVCLDSITEIAEVVLAELKDQNRDARKAYGELADVMFKVIRRFRDLPCNVYFSAKQASQDDGSGRTKHMPAMPGNTLKQGIAYMFDECFALRVERDEEGQPVRWLQTDNDGAYQAKDRSGALALFEPPSLAQLYKTIMGDSTDE